MRVVLDLELQLTQKLDESRCLEQVNVFAGEFFFSSLPATGSANQLISSMKIVGEDALLAH